MYGSGAGLSAGAASGTLAYTGFEAPAFVFAALALLIVGAALVRSATVMKG
ncbi:hypothetical protein [Pedococcus sp. 5OH_020]|jgi:hypothetical protein|uniref:hypothetical protein n=1 Tax=Pedococcus sp. 5OH_020 TaxID=2989814 RepID=UPI0022E9CE2A|nr:hypothetical protein [Pedococcus sp. 5OH_020]